jgi:hypothetical protein
MRPPPIRQANFDDYEKIAALQVRNGLATVPRASWTDIFALPHMEARRILLASRDNFSVDNKLVGALQALGCAVEVTTGAGYAAMMEEPYDAILPVDTQSVILIFARQFS